mmetsp:Transcript_27143/g.58982  ORF Transcript_27143/g.58982 Transcript_27143/m.58982 type:complete len:160 (+) Transcript_27143:1930-2409(+)
MARAPPYPTPRAVSTDATSPETSGRWVAWPTTQTQPAATETETETKSQRRTEGTEAVAAVEVEESAAPPRPSLLDIARAALNPDTGVPRRPTGQEIMVGCEIVTWIQASQRLPLRADAVKIVEQLMEAGWWSTVADNFEPGSSIDDLVPLHVTSPRGSS